SIINAVVQPSPLDAAAQLLQAVHKIRSSIDEVALPNDRFRRVITPPTATIATRMTFCRLFPVVTRQKFLSSLRFDNPVYSSYIWSWLLRVGYPGKGTAWFAAIVNRILGRAWPAHSSPPAHAQCYSRRRRQQQQ